MDWIWVLIGLTVVLNIGSFLLLIQCKKLNHLDKKDEVQAIQQSMEAFVTRMEKENDELYQQLAEYLKVNQQSTDEQLQALEEKVRLLEEKLGQEVLSERLAEPFDGQEDGNQPDADLPSDQPQDEEKIIQLFKQGFSPKQIAKILQIDNGRIELIINLFKKRQSSK